MSLSSKPNNTDDARSEDERPQRRWLRHDVTIPVQITMLVNGETHSLSGQASDISKGGLRLFLTRAIEPGTSLKMEFVLPYSSSALMIRGLVRNRNRFTHGIEFIQPTPYQRQMIERTCKVFGLLS